MPSTPAEALARRLREAPADPLVTWYDDTSGERTELSAASFANWVAKSANLLRDGLDLEPGFVVVMDLPPHWQALPLACAVWQLEGVIDASGRPASRPDLLIRSADREAALDADEELVLALRPFAMPGEPPVGGALDYDREVRVHGDHFAGPAPHPSARALLKPAGEVLDQSAVIAAALSTLSAHQRPLVALDDARADEVVIMGVAAALTGAGLVLTIGADSTAATSIAAAERASFNPHPPSAQVDRLADGAARGSDADGS
jgi:uncharacterized protein (TIGR03089 family)